MRNPLAFLGSLGASAALVGAIAVSLLTLSTVVALQGWPGLGEEADARQALVVDGAMTPPTPGGARRSRDSRRDSIVLRAPARRPRPRRVERVRPRARVSPTRSAVGRGDNLTGGRLPEISSTTTTTASDGRPPAAKTQGGAPISLPQRSGDDVRELGDDLSSGVQDAGTGLNEVPAPLGPVVAHTLRELTELIAALLRNTTHVVGAGLDGLARR